MIASLAVGITFLYASYLDIKERRVPFRTWYPMLAVAVPMAAWTYISMLGGDLRVASGYILLVVVFCLLFYVSSAYFHLFGGADAWALIFLTVCIPLYPLEPYLGYPAIAFFPLTVLLNAVILNLAAPVGILCMNIARGNKAPLRYMLVGFPVDGSRIQDSFGFVMEEFEEQDGRLIRHYISFTDAIRRMFAGERRMYTQDLKRDPEDYREELSLYRKAGTVWISYGVPFIVPITAGLVTAIFAGDIFFGIIGIIMGVI